MAHKRVSVPQSDGEIRISSVNLAAPVQKVYKVSGGHVDVDAADLPLFLRSVNGSKEVKDSPAEHVAQTSNEQTSQTKK